MPHSVHGDTSHDDRAHEAGDATRRSAEDGRDAAMETRLALARLQRAAGNRAVGAMVRHGVPASARPPVVGAALARGIHRDDTGDDADADVDDPGEIAGLDPALEAQLRELFPIDDGPGAEVITTSTGAQSTTGELTSRALQLWRREHVALDDAYRQAADEDLAPVGGSGPDVVPTRGGAAPPERPAVHWGVLLAAWDYANVRGREDPTEASGIAPFLQPEGGGNSGNLGDVRAMLRQGSPFMQAADGYDRHVVVENPSTAGMTSAIYDAADGLGALVAPGQRAQLTVNFQGHGGGGAIEGVDGEVLERGDLLRAAEYAREQGVHVTYVLDTCNAGSAALLAENREFYDVATRAQDAPPETQAALRAAGQVLVPIFQIGLELNDIATAIRFQRLRNDAERAQAVATLERAIALVEQLDDLRADHPDIPGFPEIGLLGLTPRITFRLLVERGRFSLRRLRDARETLAPLLDAINDLLSDQVDELSAIAPQAPATR